MIVAGGRGMAGGGMAVAGGGGGQAVAGGVVAGGGGIAVGGGGGGGVEAGCEGACGGAEAICIQPEGSVSQTHWKFVGAGRGGYEAISSYTHVGQGCGSYVAEEVAVPYGWRCRPVCSIGIVVALVLVGLVFLLQPSPPTTTTTVFTSTSPDPCRSVMPPLGMSEVTKAMCCRRVGGRYCPTTSSPTTQQPIPPTYRPIPPTVRPTYPPTAPLPYDCSAGAANWVAGWSAPKKVWCCAHGGTGCEVQTKVCILWGDPHIISFDQVGTDKNQALSFYGDGDFWLVKSTTVHIQGRFEGTKYTEGLAATNQIVVGGPFLSGHKIEVGTRDSGVLTVDGLPVCGGFPSSYAGAGFSLTYDSQGEVPDVVPEGNEKRVVHMSLPLGVKVSVYQWNNYVDVKIEMSPQPSQDGVCGNANGNQADDTTQAIIQRVGARVRPSEKLLSGQARIDFTPQMQNMLAAECLPATQATAQAFCSASLATPVGDNLVSACVFDECFGMNVRARARAKTYA